MVLEMMMESVFVVCGVFLVDVDQPALLPGSGRSPLAYALAFRFGLGPHGVYLAITIAFSTLAVVSAALFRRGRWKTRAV